MSYTDVEYKLKKIGKNVFIGRNVYFRYPDEVEIGDNVIIDDFSYFTTKVKIGNYVHVSPHCSIIGGKESLFVMGDFTGISAGCRIVCSSDNYLGDGMTNPTIPDRYRSSVNKGKVIMEKHSLLGTGCVVYPNVTMNEGSVAGSMSLVTKSLDEWTINYGIPCKFVKDRHKDTILQYEEDMKNKEII